MADNQAVLDIREDLKVTMNVGKSRKNTVPEDFTRTLRGVYINTVVAFRFLCYKYKNRNSRCKI